MQGLVLRDLSEGPALEDLVVDEPAAGEVAVRIAASGVCGSDLHVVHGQSAIAVLPTVLGHEASGIVDAVGPGVTAVAPGDHVVISAVGPCGQCANCVGGRPMQCGHPDRILRGRGLMPDGASRLHASGNDVFAFTGVGSMADVAVLPESMTIKIPDDVPLDVVAPVSCGVLTGLGAVLNTARPEPGATVLVMGCGGVGLNVIQACRLVGAAVIIAVDTNSSRLELAGELGATHLVDASSEDVESTVRALRPGGADIAYEVVGRSALVRQCFDLLRPGGTCVVVGATAPGETLDIETRTFLISERRLVGSFFGSSDPRRDIPLIIELYRGGRIRLDELVTGRYPLADFAQAFVDSESGKGARSLLTML